MLPGYRIQASTGLHRGDRDYQQDQVCLLHHPRHSGCLLAVVADGMGGRSGGRKASDQVMLTARQLFERYNPQRDPPAALLQQIVAEAHLVIRLTAVSSEQEPHSTIAAFLIEPGAASHWVHAGDSRIYHFRQGRLVARTADHSYVQALVDRGELSDAQALDHPQAHVLMGCLGTEGEPCADVHTTPVLAAGDTLLACSDGIWHYFSPEELASAVTLLNAREACEVLIQKARSRAHGMGDNLSLVIVKLVPLG
jgi:PPM family protein phosphatase